MITLLKLTLYFGVFIFWIFFLFKIHKITKLLSDDSKKIKRYTYLTNLACDFIQKDVANIYKHQCEEYFRIVTKTIDLLNLDESIKELEDLFGSIIPELIREKRNSKLNSLKI